MHLRDVLTSCAPKSLPFNLFADPHPLNPVVSIFYRKHGGGAYPATVEDTPYHSLKSFSCNTYEPPRKCCKQKTYDQPKPFRCNTYKKPGGTSFKPRVFLLPRRALSFLFSLFAPRLFHKSFPHRQFRTPPKNCRVSPNNFHCGTHPLLPSASVNGACPDPVRACSATSASNPVLPLTVHCPLITDHDSLHYILTCLLFCFVSSPKDSGFSATRYFAPIVRRSSAPHDTSGRWGEARLAPLVIGSRNRSTPTASESSLRTLWAH
jgi:hypothetical protein